MLEMVKSMAACFNPYHVGIPPNQFLCNELAGFPFIYKNLCRVQARP